MPHRHLFGVAACATAPGGPSLSLGAALAPVPASPRAPHPWHRLASPGQGAAHTPSLPHTCPRPSGSPPGMPQSEERSLGAGALSATLSNLRPNTEYVVTLRARYAQQPAATASLTARTRKHHAAVPMQGHHLWGDKEMGWHNLWVPFAEAGTEQTLRTNILSPTSIQVLWTAIREARGYRLEWKRATGGLTAPGP